MRRKETIRTKEACLTVGVLKGYNNAAKSEFKSTSEFADFLMSFMEQFVDDRYIPFVVSQSQVVYAKQWGCPTGGEPVFQLRSTLDTQFIDEETWQATILERLELLADRLSQETVNVTFTDVEYTRLVKVKE